MSLANALYKQGQHAAGTAIHRETLEVQKRVLGPEHPSTLNTATSLANALNTQGQYAEAAAMHEATLEVRERVLGITHPDTLTTLMNLCASNSGSLFGCPTTL
jgi:hypothetical protein